MTSKEQCEKDLLLKAAYVMRTGGILRGSRFDIDLPSEKQDSGPHCLLGALDVAVAKISCALKYGLYTHILADRVATRLPEARSGDYDSYNRANASYINKDSSNRCAWWSNAKAANAEAVALKLEEVAATIGN